MSTRKETIDFIIEKLGDSTRFTSRAMFGEYVLYADGKTVALVCDDLLYVKIVPESKGLEGVCEKDSPYPGARPHYVIEEEQLLTLEELPDILCAIAAALPVKKLKKKGAEKRR